MTMSKKPVVAKWKWEAKINSQAISIKTNGTASAPNIEEASNLVRRKLAEQFKTTELCVIVHKIHQVGNRA